MRARQIPMGWKLALLCVVLAGAICGREATAAAPAASSEAGVQQVARTLERLPAVDPRGAIAGPSYPVKQASAQADAPPSHLTADEQEMLHELEAIPQGLEEPG